MINITNSPKKLSTGNKRLTKVPIAIIISIVLLVLFAIFYAALERKQSISNQEQNKETVENKQPQSSNDLNLTSYVDSLSKNIKKNTEEESKKDEEKIKVEKQTTNNFPMNPPNNYSNSSQVSSNRDNEKELQLKKDMRLKALTSNSKLDIKLEENHKNNNQSNTNKSFINNDDEVDPATVEFVKKTLSKGYLQQEKQKPISKYELKAGWTIPAILITGLNSDLPGEILAQVSQNVYDTATGKYLLIPQGTKLVGNYSSNIIYGQERVLTAWTKLIFPNGDTLNLEGMSGTSQDGYSGFTDQVDNHYLRIFGSAFLLSSITAGIALTDNSDGEKETNADKAMSQAIEQMSTVASEMIRKNMNISPTLKVRPGYKFNIFVTKDIILEPLQLGGET
ncbi:conjugal transfer protein TrbI [Arcobacter lacus]|uniref:TrbI/VirB10 family protein n=1 Tax=Arcobacter lacus TaxID=1912876 RepID=UPI0021BB1352|nr:TrbI/VirB10 family protein [Arcobacter lacus]MCT7910714.1 conjugal transfer protein TrbI [Arcobacter lacus]